ncbi:MAG TPA: alkaline phosphatase D family protein [Methylomirabilota bacterium]|nr:alkaline phosphatase D family protein [Methylomirabilota bacterium]
MHRRVSCLIVVGTLAFGLVGAVPAASEVEFPWSVASGDPRPNSVVVWTRLEVTQPWEPDGLYLQVATDQAFSNIVESLNVWAYEEDGYAVKVRVEGLEPYTTYYYRFLHDEPTGDLVYSAVGRTKTAPTPDMNVEPTFAVVYCQDYIGRHYNAFAKLLRDHDEDIDFVVHLGDYIYETTGDPSFQNPSPDRTIEFSDVDGAIQLGSPEEPYYAAASLSNYREIYSTYRSDPVFQEVHERWPMIVIWDDHEFSNDAWGATATYFNGRVDELDEERKRNAERAFFEFAPVEIGLGPDGTLDIDSSVLWPNTRIYRDFPYGANLHLVLTDSRTERPDHLVPEDAFPGAIAVDEPTLRTVLGDATVDAIRGSLDPYVDMRFLGAAVPILRKTSTIIAAQAMIAENPSMDIVTAVRRAEGLLAGNVSTTFVNAMYQAAGLAAPFSADVQAVLPRGVSFLFMGKTAMYSSAGARNILFWDPFNLYAGVLYATVGSAVQNLLGDQQTAWLAGVLSQSPATWKVVGNSVMMTPLLVDFTHPLIAPMLPPEFPDTFRTRMLLTADQWDGFPQNRLELLGLMGMVPGTVIISGDIHATFVTDHGGGLYEFTGPAISSGTFGDLVERAVLGDPILGRLPGIEGLLAMLPQLLQASTVDSPATGSTIVYPRTTNHGYMVMSVGQESLTATLQEIDQNEVFTDYTDDPAALDSLFTATVFTVEDGELRPGP